MKHGVYWRWICHFLFALDAWSSVGLEETMGVLPTSLICVVLNQHCHIALDLG
jgi:hypothetical protein